MNIILPESTRKFPSEIEFLLPLRRSFMDYKSSGGRILVNDASPETSMDDDGGTNMYTMTLMIGVVGHGANINGGVKVCEEEYKDVAPNMMAPMVMRGQSNSLKWVIGHDPANIIPVQPSSNMLMRSATCYFRRAPLTVYTNQAVLEAANHSSDSPFWRNLYKPMEAVDRHYTFDGLIMDNTVLSIGDMAGSDERASIEDRKPKKEMGAFLDVCYTPQSKASGRVRMLVAGVSIRVRTKRTYEMTYELLSTLTFPMGFGVGDWVVRCCGYCCMATLDDVNRIVKKWRTMCEPNMPTLHVFENMKVLNISTSSGVLIRPVRLNENGSRFMFEGPYVDSMSVYHSDTLRFANISFPSRTFEPEQYASTMSRIIPFFQYTTEPRLDLSLQMRVQALCQRPVNGDATSVSLGEREPIIMTSFMSTIRSMSGNKSLITHPGKYTVAAFINRTSNTEDAVSISKEFANSGVFSWNGYINYPLPPDCGHIEPGMVLMNQDWWKPAIPGVVVRVGMSKVGDPYAVTYVESRELVVGDKLATSDGLKFTVGEKIPYKDMPVLVNVETGESFKPNLLVNTKNVTRGLAALVRSMNACMSRYDSVTSFRRMQKPKGTGVLTLTDERKVPHRLPKAYVTVGGEKLSFTDSNSCVREVMCSYGIMEVLQLRHTSLLKQHYPSTITRSLKVPRGRYRRGTPRLGETELLSMMMQGLYSCANEAVLTTDAVVMVKCSVCEALPTYCACPRPKPPTTTCQTRYSLAELNVFATTAMLNDPDKPVLTMRFKSHT
jgi:hypothetical protein